MIFFALAVIGAFAVYVMSPGERARLLRTILAAGQQAKASAIKLHSQRDQFTDAIHERTPWTFVTPALAVLNIGVFVAMLFGSGRLSDPDTLVAWGGSVGPRTTNGEWWRLAASMFVHGGFLQLLANLAGLVQLGLVLERLVGHFAFATVYFAAGIFAGLASLSSDPMTVTTGASGAIFGVYGLLAAVSVWGVLHKPMVTLPLVVIKKLAPGAAVFLLYHLATGAFENGVALNGLVMGVVSGLVVSYGAIDAKPPARRVAATLASALVIAVASAVPLRGFTDVKPEIERLVAFEERVAAVYQAEVERFTRGVATAEALAQAIDRMILPELESVRARLKAIAKVPQEYRSLVADAEEYLRLRDESWRLRATGLQKHDMLALRKADRTERASLDILDRIRPPVVN